MVTFKVFDNKTGGQTLDLVWYSFNTSLILYTVSSEPLWLLNSTGIRRASRLSVNWRVCLEGLRRHILHEALAFPSGGASLMSLWFGGSSLNSEWLAEGVDLGHYRGHNFLCSNWNFWHIRTHNWRKLLKCWPWGKLNWLAHLGNGTTSLGRSLLWAASKGGKQIR